MHIAPEPDDKHPIGNRASSRRALGATLRRPWARALIIAAILVVALACILDQMAPGGFEGVAARLFAPAPTRVVLPTATPVIPTPAPPVGVLAPPPTDCPIAAALDSLTAQPAGFSGPVQLLGKAPVWVPQLYLPQDSYLVRQPDALNPYPQIKMVWEVGPTQHPEVTARVTDIRTGELAWWRGLGGTPSSPVLDLDAGINPALTGWADTPSAFAITHAGCYRLDVSWSGGGWSTTFAVGSSSPATGSMVRTSAVHG